MIANTEGTGAEGANLQRVLNFLRSGHVHTRASLAAATGLARSTAAARIDALDELGLIRHVGPAASTGGRRSSQFSFAFDARLVVAVDLGAAHCRVAITDLKSEILASERVIIEIARGPKVVLDTVAELGLKLIADLGRTIADIAGVGIGLPGPVEHGTGRPSNPPIMPGWHDYDVPSHLHASFGAPILVDNDVNIMALGERSAAWTDINDLVFVKVATGIGAGLVLSGTLQRGAQGIAGDMGHMLVSSEGSFTVLENIASGSALAATLRNGGIDAVDARAVARLAREGSAPTLRVIRQAGRNLGAALVSLVCLTNPAVIVLGGSLAVASSELLAGVREVVYSRSLPLATSNLQVELSRAGDDAAIIGASLLIVEQAFGPG